MKLYPSVASLATILPVVHHQHWEMIQIVQSYSFVVAEEEEIVYQLCLYETVFSSVVVVVVVVDDDFVFQKCKIYYLEALVEEKEVAKFVLA